MAMAILRAYRSGSISYLCFKFVLLALRAADLKVLLGADRERDICSGLYEHPDLHLCLQPTDRPGLCAVLFLPSGGQGSALEMEGSGPVSAGHLLWPCLHFRREQPPGNDNQPTGSFLWTQAKGLLRYHKLPGDKLPCWVRDRPVFQASSHHLQDSLHRGGDAKRLACPPHCERDSHAPSVHLPRNILLCDAGHGWAAGDGHLQAHVPV
mmetsp:Transcript_4955/g.8812  ORF Transcript_4955/g.8812 Transcript_4955/m.8812 type:complete len:209 (-) Transcript_4955:554-1180(-)